MGGKGGGGGGGGEGSQYATGNIPQTPWNQGGASTEYSKATADYVLKDKVQSDAYKAQMEANRANYRNPQTGAYDEAGWRAAKGGSGFGWAADLFDRWYPEAPAAPAPAPAAAPAPEPAAPAPAAPAPEPDPAAPVVPLDPGGAIDQPATAGDALGGAVLNPPQYWVGGADSYNTAKKKATGATGDTSGAIETTV